MLEVLAYYNNKIFHNLFVTLIHLIYIYGLTPHQTVLHFSQGSHFLKHVCSACIKSTSTGKSSVLVRELDSHEDPVVGMFLSMFLSAIRMIQVTNSH